MIVVVEILMQVMVGVILKDLVLDLIKRQMVKIAQKNVLLKIRDSLNNKHRKKIGLWKECFMHSFLFKGSVSLTV